MNFDDIIKKNSGLDEKDAGKYDTSLFETTTDTDTTNKK